MKFIWKNLSELSRYYFIALVSFLFCWGVLALFSFQFLDKMFFSVAFIWHFALLTPSLKERVFARNSRSSFIVVAVKLNHYLQLFISTNKIPYKSSVVRAFSPILFCLLLMVLTGNGNLVFTLAGSFMFEVTFWLLAKINQRELENRQSTSIKPVSQETPLESESAESHHE